MDMKRELEKIREIEAREASELSNKQLMEQHVTAIAENHLRRVSPSSAGALREALREAYKMGHLEGKGS